MKDRFDLIVFDWDGTLMDSEFRIVSCMQRAADDVGVPVPTDGAARDVIGLGLTEAVMRVFPQAEPDQVGCLIAAYRRHWQSGEIAPATLFDGAQALIEGLHGRGHLLAVATGKSRRGLDKALDETGLGRFFHASRCADEACSKPHPQMLQEILVDLETAADAAVVVGDTEYDMQMAHNARVSAVGVAHGVHSAERLASHGALLCFDDLFQLSDWLYAPVGDTQTGG